MPIHQLDEHVASLIAAGEVVERPASVVKELLENALDARATQVEIRIEGGGRELVEISDDGEGIAREELPLALARHATSKLRTAEDLLAIRTLGFRGEALASIGAVARMDIVSRPSGEPAGRRIRVEAGSVERPGPAASPPGTQVRVRDLFFNVPARRKFLRSDDHERRRIQSLVGRYALAYPHVRMSLVVEGRPVLQTDGRGDPRQALAAVLGQQVGREMVPIPETETQGVRLKGFLSPPSVHRSNRREITLLVNGRWIQDLALTAAVVQAYQGLLMVGRYPMAVILLELPPDQVDVNVHPAKSEVRFRDADSVFAFVQRAVRATLLRVSPPAAEFAEPGAWSRGESARREWEPAWSLARSEVRAEAGGLWVSAGSAGAVGVPLLRAIGQVGAAYLVAEGPDGLYLIDQHAAHERVLFERIQATRAATGVPTQSLLSPAVIELGPAEADLLTSQQPALERLGYEIESFGGSAVRVVQVPAPLADLDPAAAVRAVVEDFEEDESPLGEELEARLAARICKRVAIKAGQVLTVAEQQRLLRDLEACQSPRTCPHGRPTLIHISVDVLERQFGRRG